MLRSLKDIEDYKVSATDGDIGTVSDFYFDDHHWTIRYLIVDTGGFWQGASRALISPAAFGAAEWSTRKFHLAMTREKVKNSPALPDEGPLSHQYEQKYHQYYNWPYYWGNGGIWGDGTTPSLLAASTWKEPEESLVVRDRHLRRTREVVGYRIQGTDAEIGKVVDFIVDDLTWTIRYLVVDTGGWWLGRNVLLSPRWIEKISEEDEKVLVNLPRDAIKGGPEWKPEQPVNREYETRLFDYYGRPAYWAEEKKTTP